MNMHTNEITQLFTKRYLNSKNNNFIFACVSNLEFLENIPDKCILENNIENDNAINIRIDISKIKVKDILNYILKYLNIDGNLEFNSKLDLLKFELFLRNINVVVQIIAFNLDGLELEEQMLLNEIYYFCSEYFNISTFIPGEFLKTSLLTNNRILDNRENYTLVSVEDRKLTKKFR